MTEVFANDGRLNALFIEKSYEEAMGLVHRVLGYLEGEGLAEREGLPNDMRAVFTSESLRLTTRLMQVVSWLMVQRAAAVGELSAADTLTPSRRLSAREICLAGPVFGAEALPGTLLGYLGESRALYERVMRLEEQLLARGVEDNPVHRMLGRLDRKS